MSQLPPEDQQDTPASYAFKSSVGCACGRFVLPNGATLTIEGSVHRYSYPCYRQGGSKMAGPDLPVVGSPEAIRADLVDVRQRLAALEKVVASLITVEGKP